MERNRVNTQMLTTRIMHACLVWCVDVLECACVRAQIDQKPGGNKSRGHRSAVHPNFAHLLCEVCWCVCVLCVSLGTDRRSQVERNRVDTELLATRCVYTWGVCGKCVCVESVSVCVCANVRVDSNLVSTRSPVERFEWTASR